MGWMAGLLFAQEGRLVYQSVRSPSLEGNLLGDSAYRSVIVYLPPTYDTETDRRFPVVYLLHGYNDTNTIWRDGAFQGFNILESMDRLVAAGKIREMILVMPDGRNAYGGSYYTNSRVTGNWEDFIVRELVDYVDSTYRTIGGSASRGIAGHSMGGYGALFLAIRHPDVFSSVYGLSSCCLTMEGDVGIENPEWLTTLTLRDQSVLVHEGIYPHAFISLAAALSPDPNEQPFPVDFPFQLVEGKLKREAETYQTWLDHFPAEMLDRYQDKLKALRAVRFDVGTSDRFSHIILGSRALSAALSETDIAHHFEVYEGDHTNRIGERLEAKVLPFFSEMLVFDQSHVLP
jgi:S-formylglutathione hydrolase FrmB